MISWHPRQPGPSTEVDAVPWSLEILDRTDTAAHKIRAPGSPSGLMSAIELAANLRAQPDELLSVIIEVKGLRQPVIRELAQLARLLGADELVLLALVRRVCQTHTLPR